MPARPTRLQPATREKSCGICGERYVYPVRGSTATRFHCDLCAELPEKHQKILRRMAKRIAALEKKVAGIQTE